MGARVNLEYELNILVIAFVCFKRIYSDEWMMMVYVVYTTHAKRKLLAPTIDDKMINEYYFLPKYSPFLIGW